MRMPTCPPQLSLFGDSNKDASQSRNASALNPFPSQMASLSGEAVEDYDNRPRTAPDSSGPSSGADQAPLVLPKHIKSFSNLHRKNASSIDSSIPRQTIMKALVSRPPPNSQLAISSTIQSLLSVTKNGDDGASARARRLSEAFSDLHLDSPADSLGSRLAALNSPCFFHKRFDDAVNIERVLSELQDDEWLSHSRLVQTATGVREVSRQLQRKPIRRAVRNIMIVTKARDNDLVTLTRNLAEWLICTPRYGSDVGVNVYVDSKLKHSKRFGAASLTAMDSRFESSLRYWTPDLCWRSPEKFDLVLTLGGDGTVLYTSWLFQRIVPPILSFSLGSLGFLTNFEYQNFKPALNAIMGEAGMRVNLRMRFTCTVYRAGDRPVDGPVESEQFEVLNEVVIDRGPSPYVSNLELYGDDALLTVVQADGCIFSTPTGSTAYSLSAGGSLVHPDIPAILLTPICPHTLSFRPMLLTDSMALRVAVPRNSRATAYAAFDGKGRVELRQGDYVTIAASQYPFPTVLSRQTEWIDSISRTLRWNTRAATQKGWVNGQAEDDNDCAIDDEEDQLREQKTGPDFDIDFDDEEARDSGYSAEGSSAGVGGGSPKGSRRQPLGF
jgi:NAD+ kinase